MPRRPLILEARLGTVLGGRYEPLSVLGSGGQTAVYRARDRRDGDEVAVKVLLPTTDPSQVERKYREGFAMSSWVQIATTASNASARCGTR